MELDALLAVLPPHLGAYLLTGLYVLWELSGVASWTAAALKKWVLPKMMPGRGLDALSAVIHVLDWLAINGPKLKESRAFAAKLSAKDDYILELKAVGMEQRALLAEREDTIARQATTVMRLMRAADNDNNGGRR